MTGVICQSQSGAANMKVIARGNHVNIDPTELRVRFLSTETTLALHQYFLQCYLPLNRQNDVRHLRPVDLFLECLKSF